MREEQDFRELIDLVDGQLSPEAETRLRKLLASGDDATLQAEFAWLQGFAALRERIALTTPPATVKTALMDEFRGRAKSKPSRPSLWQRIEAALSFDSWAGTGSLAMGGVRSADLDSSRQLVYSTDIADISVDLTPHDHGTVLNGQVLPLTDTDDTFFAQLVHDDNELGLVTPDELGEFTFSFVLSGNYQLIISNGQTDIIALFSI